MVVKEVYQTIGKTTTDGQEEMETYPSTEEVEHILRFGEDDDLHQLRASDGKRAFRDETPRPQGFP